MPPAASPSSPLHFRLLRPLLLSTAAMCRRRRRHVVIFFFFLLQLLLLLLTFAAHTSHAAIAEEKDYAGGGERADEEEGMMILRALGSRPPSCEGRCRSCGRRCEAVQVPVTPQEYHLHRHYNRMKKKKLLPYSSYDDHSNYKPLGWGCKCLLNP